MTVWKNTENRYGSVAMTLHWLTAVLVLVMVVLGFGRELVPHSLSHSMMSWHRSTGIVVLAVAIIRLIWRLMISRPPPLPDIPPSIKFPAYVIHGLLYLFLLVMTLTGCIMTNAAGREVSVFGLFNMPHLMAQNKAFAEQLERIHVISVYILIALVFLHTAAAFYHHFWRRDDILKRMLPNFGFREE